MLKQFFIGCFIWGSAVSVFSQSGNILSERDTITDPNIVIPQEMERDFDQLLIDWKKDLEPSVDCVTDTDGTIETFNYDDSIYIKRLHSLPTEMELVYNPIVRSYIDMYTQRQKTGVGYFLGKSTYYFPIFEKALDKYNLPLELKYLPIIESALNPTIVSKAGATGLWQFMIGTGKLYNLEINSLVDERRDPIKSSEAAAKYLRDLYAIYNDWNLVLAAYNCGPGNVNKAIKKSGGETDYWAIYQYLPKETRGYVPAFIAAAYIMNYHKEHNICPIEYKYTVSLDTIHVDKQLHLQQIADMINCSIDELRSLNPQFKKDIIPGEFREYVLKLPSMKAVDFAQNRDTIYNYKIDEFLTHRKVVEPKGYAFSAARARYKVRRGDNLDIIAKKFGASVSQLKRWNNLKSNRISVGQILAVSSKPAKSKNINQEKENDTTGLIAEVNSKNKDDTQDDDSDASGMNTSGLLAQYFARIQEENTESVENKDDDIGSQGPPPPQDVVEDGLDVARDDFQSTQTIYHKVRIGETLHQIATKYKVDQNDIKSWNKIKTALPKVGQRLIIYLPIQNELTEVSVISETVNQDTVVNENPILIEDPLLVSSDKTERSKNKKETVLPIKSKNKKAEPKNRTSIYTVKKGDTLGHIAILYGKKMTPARIRKANNLKSDKLSIGQKLKIPNV